ncbi:MAG: metallophosphoesterase, partial [Spirochaetota bacterium]
MRHFIVGDIHACAKQTEKILSSILKEAGSGDRVVFCGDYIDRGGSAFAVVEMLVRFAEKTHSVFLAGNHETMLESYLNGEEYGRGSYLLNGGSWTKKDYEKNLGSFYIPDSHRPVLFSRTFYYEADDFYVVHAGFDPRCTDPVNTAPYDMVWLREKFYRSSRIWEKTVIFGHTPTHYLGMTLGA